MAPATEPKTMFSGVFLFKAMVYTSMSKMKPRVIHVPHQKLM